MILRPVLTPIPQREGTRIPDQVKQQQASARAALRECARLCGAPQNGWKKNAAGAPLPQDGWYWSITHKRLWAAAVIADRPVGIDIEHVAPRRNEAIMDAAASPEEWDMLRGRSWPTFFRLWTAKEAVLKANGTGVAGLSACRLVEVTNSSRMTLQYKGQTWPVEHFFHNSHVAAITCETDAVDWHVADDL